MVRGLAIPSNPWIFRPLIKTAKGHMLVFKHAIATIDVAEELRVDLQRKMKK